MGKRVNRLRSKPALIGLVSIVLLIWKIIEALDTLKGVVENMNTVWHFLSTPIGMLMLLVVGLGLIAYSVLRPEHKKVSSVSSSIGSATEIESSQRGNELTQEQIAENLIFIQKVRGVAERLLKNSQGAETRSIKSIAHNICSETPVREYITSDGLAGQTGRLLTHQLDDFFIRVSNYQRQMEGLSIGNLDDTIINSICNTTRELVFDYRRLVDEVMVMLTNLENRGVEALWHKAPWPVRIHRDLADNYDELMRLVVDLKAVTPSYARDLLPKDDQTSKFKRASLWS